MGFFVNISSWANRADKPGQKISESDYLATEPTKSRTVIKNQIGSTGIRQTKSRHSRRQDIKNGKDKGQG